MQEQDSTWGLWWGTGAKWAITNLLVEDAIGLPMPSCLGNLGAEKATFKVGTWNSPTGWVLRLAIITRSFLLWVGYHWIVKTSASARLGTMEVLCLHLRTCLNTLSLGENHLSRSNRTVGHPMQSWLVKCGKSAQLSRRADTDWQVFFRGSLGASFSHLGLLGPLLLPIHNHRKPLVTQNAMGHQSFSSVHRTIWFRPPQVFSENVAFSSGVQSKHLGFGNVPSTWNEA